MRKKQVMALLLSAMMAAGGMLAGCGEAKTPTSSSVSSTSSSVEAGSEDTESSSSSSESEAVEDEFADIPVTDEDAPLEDCVTVGDYKGMELTKTITNVTDEEAKAYAEDMAELVEVEDESYTAKEGDTVDIAYVGTIDGEEFEGGSSESFDLELGSGSMIDGFEDGVIGMKKGEEKDLNLKFPDDYYSEDLSGKDAVFHVTVNAIKQASEVTDEDIASAKKQLEEQAETEATENLRYAAWEKLLEISEIKQFRQSDLDKNKEEIDESTKQWIESMGNTMEEYLESIGQTQEEYDADMLNYAKSITKEQMISEYVANAEGMSLEDPEQDEMIAKYAEDYGVSVEDFIASYGENTVNESIMTQRVMDKIVSYAKVTEEHVDAADYSEAEDLTVVDDADGNTDAGGDAEDVEVVEEASEE